MVAFAFVDRGNELRSMDAFDNADIVGSARLEVLKKSEDPGKFLGSLLG